MQVDVLLTDQNNMSMALHPDGLPISRFDGVKWPTVDPKRIYVAGYSLGGLVAQYASVLEPRLAGVASIAGFTPLRSSANAIRTGGNDLLSKWHSIQPRLGWFDDRQEEIPFDYDDMIAVAKKPSLVVAPEGDRAADHPALMNLLKSASNKLGPDKTLLTVVETQYSPPKPKSPDGAYPAQGINRLSIQHQSILLDWLNNVSLSTA